MPSTETRASKAARAAARGTYPGTEELVDELVRQSKFTPAWRPLRAAALLADATPPDDHVWMTKEEFATWVTANGMARRRGATTDLADALGMGSKRRLNLLSGAQRVTKVEALACAHYALRLPMPIPAGEPFTFDQWVTERFGPYNALAASLGLVSHQIGYKMRGFEVRDGERLVRLPDAALIRAIDWVWRVGAICPYGSRLPVAYFPGQEIDT